MAMGDPRLAVHLAGQRFLRGLAVVGFAVTAAGTSPMTRNQTINLVFTLLNRNRFDDTGAIFAPPTRMNSIFSRRDAPNSRMPVYRGAFRRRGNLDEDF